MYIGYLFTFETFALYKRMFYNQFQCFSPNSTFSTFRWSLCMRFKTGLFLAFGNCFSKIQRNPEQSLCVETLKYAIFRIRNLRILGEKCRLVKKRKYRQHSCKSKKIANFKHPKTQIVVEEVEVVFCGTHSHRLIIGEYLCLLEWFIIRFPVQFGIYNVIYVQNLFQGKLHSVFSYLFHWLCRCVTLFRFGSCDLQQFIVLKDLKRKKIKLDNAFKEEVIIIPI